MRKLLLVFCLFIQLSWALDRQPNADYHARRQALASKIKNGVVLLFAPNEAEGPNDLYGYRPDDNFFYLSGWPEPGAALLIAASPEHPYTEILFLPDHNPSQEKWTGPKLGPEDTESARITGFDRIAALDNLRSELVRLLPAPKTTIYTDILAGQQVSNSTSALDWLKRANSFPVYVSFQDVRPLLASLRTVKDAGEIERIRKATDASVAAHLAAMRATKPGMTERGISALIQYEWGKRGCERPAYAPIVGSGFNSAVLHYSQDSETIKDGDVVLIDAAGEYSMYASDITRTLPASGKFSARQREIYDIVLGAQRAAITHGKDLHGEPLGKYFIHGLSHYVGLNVHDEGDYDVPAGPGMVFTIEPGIYIPEEKLGVRIEDVFYVDPGGKLINLSGALPHTPDEVERVMANK